MSLNKAIKSGKEHRKPYKGAKAIDCTCRNHGGCPYCESNRMYQFRKQIERTNYELFERNKGGDYGKEIEKMLTRP